MSSRLYDSFARRFSVKPAYKRSADSVRWAVAPSQTIPAGIEEMVALFVTVQRGPHLALSILGGIARVFRERRGNPDRRVLNPR